MGAGAASSVIPTKWIPACAGMTLAYKFRCFRHSEENRNPFFT